LSAALELLQAAGADTVEARVLSNTGWLLENLPSLPGLRLVSATAPERRSGIVTFRPAAGSTARLHRALQEIGIACAVRNQAIRLSPHFYQGTAELERLLRGIEQGMAVLRAD
jgi:selenocysteine lyase/cysteine desulfurase